MFDEVITDTLALQMHYLVRDGFIFTLTIENCPKIRDFSFLSKLTNLHTLNLIGNNKIPDLSFLKQMRQLETFRFSMDVVDGDLSLCKTIKKVRCLRQRRHYTSMK